jgi:DNA-binding transcriptional ArsR family regulator
MYRYEGSKVQQVLQAISEPRRREILRLVREGELAAGDIAAHFDVTRPAVSQHLTILKNAGLLRERREGTRRFYIARPEALGELRAFLDDFWAQGLQHLKQAAEEEERRGRHARAAKRN